MLPWNWNIIFSFEWEHPQCLSTEIKEEEKKIRLNDPTNKIFPFFTSGVSTASSSALGSPWTSGATSVSGAGVSGAAASSGGAASSTQSRVKKESYRWIKTEHTASRALTTGGKKAILKPWRFNKHHTTEGGQDSNPFLFEGRKET